MYTQESLAVLFRSTELQRRHERRKRLQLLIKNELELSEEPLTEEERRIHRAALVALQRQNLAFEREQSPGYLKRLWYALLNK